MATITQGDTWPPLRGLASDAAGALNLSTASALQVICKATGVTITGTPTAVQPPQTDADGNSYNWQYQWAAADTNTPGVYDVALKVTWDSGTTPPHVEYVPNGTNPSLTIKAKLA
jgi:hypothetical protein